ncbi:MAG: YabP/YqfC family sporulation protein [Clostridia bacterium]|nr:YabP/YqfC family sporulation protein [Clostridia bacterium]
MAFLDSEIKNLSGGGIIPKFRAIFMGDSSVYIESVLNIKSYSEKEIVLGVKKGVLSVSGEDLFIKKYCAGDVLICGKISGFLIK